MKSITKFCLLTFVVCVMTSAMAFAKTDAFMGTWKLNASKSKLSDSGPKNETVTYEDAGDQIKVTLEVLRLMEPKPRLNGPASLMARIISLQEIQTKTCDRSNRSTTA